MSADFIYTLAAVSDAPPEELHARVGELTDLDLFMVGDSVIGDIVTAGEVVESLNEAIDQIVGSYRSDMAIIDLGTGEFYISGGMSNGDDPTDAFTLITLLRESEVTDDEKWASR